jgi:hypothetical protein
MSPILDTISNLLLNCLLLFYQLVIQKNLTTSHGTIVGGCFVEGDCLRNASRWRESIGP